MATPIQVLKEKWDEYSTFFQRSRKSEFAINLDSSSDEPSTMITAYSMLTMLRLHEASKVLEVGCGAGAAATLAQKMMRKDTEFHLLDLSPEMLKLAQERVNASSSTSVPAVKSFQVGNLEELPFQDETFDRVYANYVLHLTPNPDKGLQEVRRVLQKGGMAGFSVWGRPENCPKFTIPEEAKASINLPTKLAPSFHLHDMEKLKERVLKAGFSKVIAWYQTEPFHVLTADEFVRITIYERPPSLKEFNSWSEKDQETYKKTLHEVASRILANGPIMSESLIVLAWV